MQRDFVFSALFLKISKSSSIRRETVRSAIYWYQGKFHHYKNQWKGWLKHTRFKIESIDLPPNLITISFCLMFIWLSQILYEEESDRAVKVALLRWTPSGVWLYDGWVTSRLYHSKGLCRCQLMLLLWPNRPIYTFQQLKVEDWGSYLVNILSNQ